MEHVQFRSGLQVSAFFLCGVCSCQTVVYRQPFFVRECLVDSWLRVADTSCDVGGSCQVPAADKVRRWGTVRTPPCVRRGPGLRASRQHPSQEGG